MDNCLICGQQACHCIEAHITSSRIGEFSEEVRHSGVPDAKWLYETVAKWYKAVRAIETRCYKSEQRANNIERRNAELRSKLDNLEHDLDELSTKIRS